MLQVVARVVEILFPDSDLNQRVYRLLVRLELGVPGKILEIATRLGKKLARGDYLRLLSNNICTMEAIESAEEKKLLEYLEGNRDKLSAIHDALTSYRDNTSLGDVSPILPQYVG